MSFPNLKVCFKAIFTVPGIKFQWRNTESFIYLLLAHKRSHFSFSLKIHHMHQFLFVNVENKLPPGGYIVHIATVTMNQVSSKYKAMGHNQVSVLGTLQSSLWGRRRTVYGLILTHFSGLFVPSRSAPGCEFKKYCMCSEPCWRANWQWWQTHLMSHQYNSPRPRDSCREREGAGED